MIRFKGLIAPTEVPTGDGRMFAKGKMTHRPCPIPLMVKFGSGSHIDASPVGKLEEIYPGEGGYWASGSFLDPAMVPEVPKAVYMLQEKVLGPSVDLDRDFVVKVMPHPTRPDKKSAFFEEYNVIGTTLVPMPAFYQVHLSVDTAEEKALLASVGVREEWLVDDLDTIDLGNPELITASVNSDDEAECGCAGEESSLGRVPMSESGNITVGVNSTNTPIAFTVSGAQVPTSVTLTFDGGMYRMPGMMGEETPHAVVKVLGDTTVIKVPHTVEEKEECYFNEDGMCPVCGY